MNIISTKEWKILMLVKSIFMCYYLPVTAILTITNGSFLFNFSRKIENACISKIIARY